MNDESLLKSRTAWASIIAIAGTQLDAFKALPTTLQAGVVGVACSYILARGFQTGCQALAKALTKKAA